MLGRDMITINFRDRSTNAEFSRTVYGAVVTEQVNKADKYNDSLTFQNYYRLILPRTLDWPDASLVSVDFGAKSGRRFEIPVTPIYDSRGRVRHYEGIVRSG